VLFFSSSYLKTVKTVSLFLLFYGKGLLGFFRSMSALSEKKRMWKNKE